MLRKLFGLIVVLLLGGSVGLAQFTTVSATVVDSDSTTWASAPYTWSFQPGPNQSNPANYTYNGSPLASFSGSGVANGSGVISVSGVIYDVTLIRPIGASYNLIVCPNASTKCSTVNFAPSGSSVSLTTQVNAAILAPRFQAVSGAYGYNDGEAVLQLQPGSTYWNTTSGVQRCYTGSVWGSCSAGGTVPNPLTNGQQAVTQPNAGDQSADVATDLFVQKALDLSMAYTPFANVTGGVYSFDSQGSGALVNYMVSGGAISSITTWIPFVGSGYLVGDIITPQAGNFDAMIRVTAVSGSGAPTAGTILYGGTGYSAGTSVAASSAQALQFTFAFSGALTSNAYIIFQHGSYLTTSQQYIVSDNTTGNPTYSVILCVAGATDACAAGGRTVTLVEGTNDDTNTFVQTDGVANVDNAIGTLLPGAKAVTQALGDNTTAVATDAFVLANGGGVTKISAGTNVSILPSTGVGDVTISATGTYSGIPYAVSVTSAPYNAACDASTDDTTAINACLAANGACFIPWAVSATQCNHSGTIHLCAPGTGDYNALYGFGGILAYTGSGTSIDFGSASGNCTESVIQDVNQDMSSSTGTPVAIDIGGCYQCSIVNDEDYNGPSGYISLSTVADGAAYSTITNYEGGGILNVTQTTSPLAISGGQFASATLGGTSNPEVSISNIDIDVGAIVVTDGLNLTLINDTLSGLTLPASPSHTTINGNYVGTQPTGKANGGVLSVWTGTTAYTYLYPFVPNITLPCVGANGIVYPGNNSGVGVPCS